MLKTSLSLHHHQANTKKKRKGKPEMQSNEQQGQFEGLLLVEANEDEERTVDIYTMQSGEMVLLESGGETFARTWLCKHARRLVSWKPRRLHDELSGIWRRFSLQQTGRLNSQSECFAP
jgi:hypothetical protein